ncbi:aromatic ring-hydroxylating dioxygenase subunit alpha [Verrucosispora sp. SN26_14.1]|uniref:aromatic ring-hydroxylating oxygenase subunit alpha n=1 Tax=Verrucosispora sp. SN26_14.1 TaxID=2527879 RepID=UPI001375A8E8|nr:aromatic ring-hydroxylating dioxygenase subunit alpha [Verrucosispora sp. SN26_14.1]
MSELVPTLPAGRYCAAPDGRDDAVLARSWQLVALTTDLDAPGRYVRAEATGRSVLVVNDGGTVRAWHNVCPHRGAELVTADRGTVRSLRCPYHAWTYGLDGALRAAPGLTPVPDLTLSGLRVAVRDPFVFVTFSADTAPFDEMFGDLFDSIAEFGVDLPTLARQSDVETLDFPVRADWKIVVENSLECYHCAVAHPGLASSLDLRTYRQQTATWWSVQRSPMRGEAGGRGDGIGADARIAATSGGGQAEARFHFLFPNLFVSVWPGSAGFSYTLVRPLPDGTTRSEYRRFHGPGATERERADSRSFIRQVIDEDVALCESVQRGLRSGAIPHGWLRIGGVGADESCIAHFGDLVRRLTADG